MVSIYLNGQDIARLVLGCRRDDNWDLETFEVGPEAYLATLQTWMKKQHISPKQLETVWAVVGPGSATALRTSLSIVNTFRFVLEVPVIGLEKDPVQDDATVLQEVGEDHESETDFLQPLYAHQPRITLSTKDVLGRRKKE